MSNTSALANSSGLRPIVGELTASWLNRLATCHRLPPKDLLRAITGPPPNRPLVAPPRPGREVYLGHKARERLASFTGLTPEELAHTLPATAYARPEMDRDASWSGWHVPHQPWHTACGPCTRRHTRATPRTPILVYVTHARHVCRRHRRWLLATWDSPSFIDLTAFPDILNAHRRHIRLARRRPDTADAALAYAHCVVWSWQTTAWAEERIWPRRAAALARLLDLNNPVHVAAHPLIPYPETIAVAELMADPAWQHHIRRTSQHFRAKRQLANDVHIELARRTGRPWLPKYLARATPGPTTWNFSSDPLQGWLDGCMSATTRAVLWRLPNSARVSEDYSERTTALVHSGPRPTGTRAQDLGLAGGWQFAFNAPFTEPS